MPVPLVSCRLSEMLPTLPPPVSVILLTVLSPASAVAVDDAGRGPAGAHRAKIDWSVPGRCNCPRMRSGNCRVNR